MSAIRTVGIVGAGMMGRRIAVEGRKGPGLANSALVIGFDPVTRFRVRAAEAFASGSRLLFANTPPPVAQKWAASAAV